MNWFELINKATEYIENNLTSNILGEDVAKHCNVSYHYFSKTFSLITGYSLMEYIRNRRITLASYDISNTNIRIIDIALKYQYSSNEAFSRAFKKIHGINPSIARKNHITVFTHFPVIQYDIPKPNILSLRYDFLSDVEYEFIGEDTYIIEKDYEKTQQLQLDFVKSFTEKYPSNNTLYRVHHDIYFDDMRYNYLVGYNKTKYNDNNLKTLQIKAAKVIRFISNNISIDSIPNIKKIIYTEWEKNRFIADGKCEIEYVLKNQKGTFDFYYLVSIV